MQSNSLITAIARLISGVVLSLFDDKGMPQNGFLRCQRRATPTHDVFNLNLQAELLVLSACKT